MKIKATNKILSLVLVAVMLISNFAMMLVYAEADPGTPNNIGATAPCELGNGSMVIDFTKFADNPENGITYKNGGVRFDGVEKGNISAQALTLDTTLYPMVGNRYEVSYWIEAADDSTDRATFSTIHGRDSSGNSGRFSWTIYGNNAQLTHARYYQNGTNKGSLNNKPQRDVVDGKQFFKVVIDGTNMQTKVDGSDTLYGEVSLYALSGGEYKLYDTRWHALETSKFYFMFWAWDTINEGDYMEVGDVTLTQLCVDTSKDHKCDKCQSVMSECYDGTTVDHKCDVCEKVISECTFNQKVINNDYKATNANCTDKATYKYSCLCGAAGTATFEYGVPLGHVDGNDEDHICDRDGCTQDNVPETMLPKDYADAEDKEKLWDVDFSSEYFTHDNKGAYWQSNLADNAVIFEEYGAALKIDGPKVAVDAEGNPTEEIEEPSDLSKLDSRFIGQLAPFDLENKTYSYEFEYFRKGVVRSKFYYANGTFIDFGGCDTKLPCLALEVNNGGYRHMRNSSANTTGVVGKPNLIENAETGEKTTNMKVVLAGGAKIENVTLYEGSWTNFKEGAKTWTGDVIPVTFTIYNTIIKEDGSAQDVRAATGLIYQPADVKLVFGVGEYNDLKAGEYYGVRNLAVYKGDTSIPFDFKFDKVYEETGWGAKLSVLEPKGITNSVYNYTNGYEWAVLGSAGVAVDSEGIVIINRDDDNGTHGAYTPHPFGKDWNQGYYEMELTVNNAHRLKLDIISSGDQSRVGFNILPNGTAESLLASMGDKSAYLAAGNAASIYVSAGNTFGEGVINAGGIKTIIYDTFNGTDDLRNVRDYGGNRANVKITYDCVNYIITLYEKCNSEWLPTAAIDYSEAVEQELEPMLCLGFMAYDKGVNGTVKNLSITKGFSAAHIHYFTVADYTSEVYSVFDAEIPTALANEFAAKYGLTGAKFGWTVDGKTFCEDIRDAYDNLDSTTYGPQNIKLAPMVVYDTPATDPVIRGVQVKYSSENDKYDVRFISAIGEDLEKFSKIGYDVKKTVKVGGETTVTTHNLETDKVSVFINANGMRYYAEALGGKYAVATGLKNEAVIENSEVTYEVTAYYIARNGAKVVCGDAVSFVFVDGQYTVA